MAKEETVKWGTMEGAVTALVDTEEPLLEMECDVVTNDETEKEEDKKQNHAARKTLEERRRRAREIKQRFRVKKKGKVQGMRDQVQQLEEEYKRLFTITVAKRSQTPSFESVALFDKFRTMYEEEETLRVEIAQTKQKVHEYDLFKAFVAGYQPEFELPTALQIEMEKLQVDKQLHQPEAEPPPSSSFKPLDVDDCHRIIRDSLQNILHPTKWKEPRFCVDAEAFGWKVDHHSMSGTTFQYSMSKSYPYASAQFHMERMWHFVITDAKMWEAQPTVENELLQVISPDIAVIRRSVCVSPTDTDAHAVMYLLVYRVKTENGYVIGARALDPLTRSESNEVTWLKMRQWFVFKELPLLDDNFKEIEQEDYSDECDSGASMCPFGAMKCTATFGGIFDSDEMTLMAALLVEILQVNVHWDNAVGGARLCFYRNERHTQQC